MSLRTDKVSSLIREELGVILNREIDLNTIGFVTVTNVITSPDLKLAKVYISIFGDDDKQNNILKEVKLLKYKFRKMLGSKLNLKFTPDLNFYIDDTLSRMNKIENLIKEIHQNDNK